MKDLIVIVRQGALHNLEVHSLSDVVDPAHVALDNPGYGLRLVAVAESIRIP